MAWCSMVSGRSSCDVLGFPEERLCQEIIPRRPARKMMSNYYDTLRAIVEAMAVLDGYKVYSHEAFTFYLKEKGESLAAEKYDRFRRIRNRINYYGQNISVAEVAEHAEGIQKLIRTLTEAYLKDL